MAAVCGAPVASLVSCKAARPAAAARPLFAPCAGLQSSKALRTVSPRSATVEEGFAQLALSCRAVSGKGALGSRCDVASEVFGVVPLIGGMILTGIALGFVLLRVEAWVEESSQESK